MLFIVDVSAGVPRWFALLDLPGVFSFLIVFLTGEAAFSSSEALSCVSNLISLFSLVAMPFSLFLLATIRATY